ncbi:MAG: histidine phosphatase family protein [bacterium]
MKIYFVRHGQTEHNKAGKVTGHIESVLTPEGIAQAQKTATELPPDFSIIYSSDLIRCKQTAEILNQKLQLPVIFDPRLRERNFGSLEGKSWSEIGEDIREVDKNQQYDYRPFGGEYVEDVKKRIFDFIREISRTEKGKKVLVVTSAGVIRLLHNILNGEVHEHVHNAAVHEFDFPEKF